MRALERTPKEIPTSNVSKSHAFPVSLTAVNLCCWCSAGGQGLLPTDKLDADVGLAVAAKVKARRKGSPTYRTNIKFG